MNNIDWVISGIEFKIISDEPMPEIMHNKNRIYRFRSILCLECKVLFFWVTVCDYLSLESEYSKYTSIFILDYTIKNSQIQLIEKKPKKPNKYKGGFIVRMLKTLYYGR